jgi:hypothetical protein
VVQLCHAAIVQHHGVENEPQRFPRLIGGQHTIDAVGPIECAANVIHPLAVEQEIVDEKLAARSDVVRRRVAFLLNVLAL